MANENQAERPKKGFLREKIREIARKHFADDFPNPVRRGCPPISEITLLEDKPLEGKDWVLRHISFCSLCYRDFGYFLHSGRKKRSSGRKFSVPPGLSTRSRIDIRGVGGVEG